MSTGAVLGGIFGAGVGIIAAAVTLSEVDTSLDTSCGITLRQNTYSRVVENMGMVVYSETWSMTGS